MKYTNNLNLKKPDGTDIVIVNDLNENMDVLDTEIDKKVDKVVGKGLSTEDFTTVEKNKLAGIAAGAQPNAVISVAGKTGSVTVTKSDVGLTSVENYGVATTAEAQAGTSNAKYMTPLRVKEAVTALAPASTWANISGKPSTFPPSTHSHTKADVGLGSVPNVDTSNASNISSGTLPAARLPAATTSAQGAMSAADKVKLNGIATGAQVNPTIATQAQAEAGTDNIAMMTALRVKQAITQFLVYQ